MVVRGSSGGRDGAVPGGGGAAAGVSVAGAAESDDLDEFADADGIVCLPSVRVSPRRRSGCRSCSLAPTERLVAGSVARAPCRRRVDEDGSRVLAARRLLQGARQVFKNRPFIWHVWDGRKDGFAAW